MLGVDAAGALPMIADDEASGKGGAAVRRPDKNVEGTRWLLLHHRPPVVQYCRATSADERRAQYCSGRSILLPFAE